MKLTETRFILNIIYWGITRKIHSPESCTRIPGVNSANSTVSITE